jgi:hypothetical protein
VDAALAALDARLFYSPEGADHAAAVTALVAEPVREPQD